MKKIGLSVRARTAAITCIAHLGHSGVDDHHGLIAYLHGDVSAGAGDHVYIALHVKHFDFAIVKLKANASRRQLAANRGQMQGAVWRGTEILLRANSPLPPK